MIIRWNGRPLKAIPGDTIAMTLWRHGIRGLGYSRKRHRLLGAGNHVVQGALVTVDGIPNVHADHQLARDGMNVTAQGAWPWRHFDLLKLLRFVPERWTHNGFERPYFLRSGTRRFEWWEQLLMQVAGAAQPPTRPITAPVGHRWDGDLVVVGGGPSGVRVANQAARLGKRVCLVTRSPTLGTYAASFGHPIEPLHPQVHLLPRHDAVGVYRRGTVVLAVPYETRDPACVLVTQQLMLATGLDSIGPLVPGNHLPGVIEPRTALRWAKALGADFGSTVVVGSGLEAPVAQILRRFGVDVRRVIGYQHLKSIGGDTAVRGVVTDDDWVACRNVVHAGPWIAHHGLAFQASASGIDRLVQQTLPAHVEIIGAANQGVPHADSPVEPLSPTLTVCACMDVTAGDIARRLEHGECHIEEIKRSTACGMGPCQGHPCWQTLRTVMTQITGQPHEDTPTSRPPSRGITVAQAAALDGLLELE